MSYTYSHPHPAVTTDIAVFTIKDERLHLLLIKRNRAPFRNHWALPGGFVRLDEDLDAGASRELREETGLSGFYLEQLQAFGAVDRDPRERVITIAYLALIRSDHVELKAGTDADHAVWWRADRLPDLAFDHASIIEAARARIADKLETSALAFQLLPQRFTMRELHHVYETVLEQKLDRRNFYKKMHALDLLADTGATRVDGPQRPAAVYQLRPRAGSRQ